MLTALDLQLGQFQLNLQRYPRRDTSDYYDDMKQKYIFFRMSTTIENS